MKVTQSTDGEEPSLACWSNGVNISRIGQYNRYRAWITEPVKEAYHSDSQHARLYETALHHLETPVQLRSGYRKPSTTACIVWATIFEFRWTGCDFELNGKAHSDRTKQRHGDREMDADSPISDWGQIKFPPRQHPHDSMLC